MTYMFKYKVRVYNDLTHETEERIGFTLAEHHVHAAEQLATHYGNEYLEKVEIEIIGDSCVIEVANEVEVTNAGF